MLVPKLLAAAAAAEFLLMKLFRLVSLFPVSVLYLMVKVPFQVKMLEDGLMKMLLVKFSMFVVNVWVLERSADMAVLEKVLVIVVLGWRCEQRRCRFQRWWWRWRLR